MNEYRIRRARPIAAEMRVPGDFLISQRAVAVAGLANGPSVLTGFLPATECMETIQTMRALGAKFDYLSTHDSDLPWASDGKSGPAGPSRLRVFGAGGRLRPRAPGQPLVSGLLGNAIAVARDTQLLDGMLAEGKTTVTDAGTAPDHLEQILRYYQVKTLRKGLTVSIWGGQMPESRDFRIPGDFTYAAAFIGAAAAQAGSILTVRSVGLNPTRTAFLRVLVRMGAQVREEIGDARGGEAYGNVIIRGAPLRGTTVEADEAVLLQEELPVLMLTAALAEGSTVIRQAPGVEERIARMAHNLRLMGVEVAPVERGVEIKGMGGTALQPGVVPSGRDPNIAMASAVAGFFTDGETIVEDVECVEARWHGFGADLERFQSREISEGQFTPMLHAVPRVPKGREEKKEAAAEMKTVK